MAPSDENECRQMLYTGFTLDLPAAVRYPRGGGAGVDVMKQMEAITVGKAEIRRQGKRVAILAFGSVVYPCHEVGDIIDATVVNMRFVKPLDESMIDEICSNHEFVITVEENVIQGGAGSAVNEYIAENDIEVKVYNCGLPDRLIPHGSQDDMLKEAGLTKDGILDFIESHIKLTVIENTAKTA
ncbi:MAG: 1-deoxy-D-xylulose-5-phosphate synthase, partial [Gammaproteobacteria bacterium]|nr:1-deoxy-D-xylulose-5-phosphate synthase [Gammaproteobacteria bacterium]